MTGAVLRTTVLRTTVTLVVATAAFTLSLVTMDRVNVWLSTGGAAAISLGLAAWAGLARRRRPPRRALGDLALGLGAGIALVLLTHLAFRLAVAVLPALDGLVTELYGDLAVPPGPLAALPLTALVVLAEEAVWRGVLVDRLEERLERRRGGRGAAEGDVAGESLRPGADRRRFRRTALVAVATLLYGLPHLLAGEPVLLAAALVLGAVWTVLRVATGSLAAPFACHLTWSATLFALWPLT